MQSGLVRWWSSVQAQVLQGDVFRAHRPFSCKFYSSAARFLLLVHLSWSHSSHTCLCCVPSSLCFPLSSLFQMLSLPSFWPYILTGLFQAPGACWASAPRSPLPPVPGSLLSQPSNDQSTAPMPWGLSLLHPDWRKESLPHSQFPVPNLESQKLLARYEVWGMHTGENISGHMDKL